MDAIGERITWLVAHELEKLAVDATGWDTLYRDPNDGRLWELTFPMSDGEGGGPPRLECIDLARARGKYGTRSA